MWASSGQRQYLPRPQVIKEKKTEVWSYLRQEKQQTQAALQREAAGRFYEMPASSPSLPVRQTREGWGDWISPAREEAQAKMEVALLLEGEAEEHCVTSSG